MTILAAEAAYRLDENGFPAIPCPRCAGTGTLPQFHMVHHGVCYQCNGGKVAWPTPTVRKAAQAARQMLRDAGQVGHTNEHGTYDQATGDLAATPINLTPGMAIRRRELRRGPGGELVPPAWRTVATVRRGTQIWGGSLVILGRPVFGDYGERNTQDWWIEAIVTFTDGSRARIGSESWEAKPGTDVLQAVEATAAESRAAYDKLLARRAKTTQHPANNS